MLLQKQIFVGGFFQFRFDVFGDHFGDFEQVILNSSRIDISDARFMPFYLLLQGCDPTLHQHDLAF